MWKLKDSIKDHIYETDSQTQRTALRLPRGRGVKEGSTGSLGLADANYDMCVCYVLSRSVMSDCGITESSVRGDSPGKILEWVAMTSSRESSQPRDWTQVSYIAGGLFTI